MKILLIDDEALRGWKEVIEKVLFKGNKIDCALNYIEASELLIENSYDLIFLDLRFGESDHKEKNIETFGGYKVLNELIRSEFANPNFSTPVLLFTATNKAWNIFEMLECGADNFYIKEHPNTSHDIEFSKNNYNRLLKNTKSLIELGIKKKEVWNKIQNISKLTFTKINNSNIKKRVNDKLKIGYGILFRPTSRLEKKELLFSNEIIAYIIFWSILEEIVKDNFKDNWIKSGDKEGEMVNNLWVLNNGTPFIEDFRTINLGKNEGVIRVGIKYDKSRKYYKADSVDIECDNPEVKFYSGKINLSQQVFAVLLLEKGWVPLKVKNQFSNLNEYRNKIDFIHSSITAIFNHDLNNPINYDNAYDKCLEMLQFLEEILE